MLSASVKEVEILKDEVKEIKACINRYISYIIGTNGVVLLLYKFVTYKYVASGSINRTNEFLNEVNAFTSFYNYIPIFSVLLIMSLYFILCYKFASHNRHIGYTQLVSQEIKYKQIEDSKKLPIYNTDNLDKGLFAEDLDETTIPKTILSWDSIMSRFSSRLKPKKYPKRHYENLDFRFLLSDGSKYSNLNEYQQGNETYNIIQGFLKNIIYAYYTENLSHGKYYHKFDTKSWNYPRYVFFLTVVQVAALIPIFLMMPYVFWFKAGLISVISGVFCYFIFDLYHIMNGKKSINYYCWSFFTYRVQLLNSYGVRPVYYSTSFLRYFKAAKVINYLKNDKHKKDLQIEMGKYGLSQGDLTNLINKLNKGLKISGPQRRLSKYCRNKLNEE